MPGVNQDSSAVAEVVEMAKRARRGHPLFSTGAVETDIGKESWDWPFMPKVQQKPVDYRIFVGEHGYLAEKNIFTKGAHMPLTIYVGSDGDTRRSKEARAKRQARAESRGCGWGRAQREAREKGKGTKGGKANDDAVVTAKGYGTSTSDFHWWNNNITWLDYANYSQHFQHHQDEGQQQGADPWAGYQPLHSNYPPQGATWQPAKSGYRSARSCPRHFEQLSPENPWRAWQPEETRGSGGKTGGEKGNPNPRPTQAPPLSGADDNEEEKWWLGNWQWRRTR